MSRLASLLRRILPLIVLAIGAFIVFQLVQSRKEPARGEVQEVATPVRIVSALTRDLRPTVRGFGLTRPESQWRAVAEVSGNVIEVAAEFRAGTLVREGDLLVRIDPIRYEIQVAEFEADVERLDAALSELDAQKLNFEASLEVESSSLVLTEVDVKRGEEMVSRKTLADAELDDMRRAMLQQKAVVAGLQNQLRLLPSQRRGLDAQKLSAQKKLHRAKIDLERTVIRAPYDARLADVEIEVGQYVPSGTLMLTADSIAITEVVAQMQISHMLRILPKDLRDDVEFPFSAQKRELLGKALEVRVKLRDGEFEVTWEARFVGIGDTIDPKTRTVAVVVAVDDPYLKARPPERPPLVKGMFVDVELTGPTIKSALLVPGEALRGRELLLADDDDRLRRREIELGFRQGGLALITAGIEAGERVIISDPVPAVAGMLLDCRADEEAHRRLIGEQAR